MISCKREGERNLYLKAIFIGEMLKHILIQKSQQVIQTNKTRSMGILKEKIKQKKN